MAKICSLVVLGLLWTQTSALMVNPLATTGGRIVGGTPESIMNVPFMATLRNAGRHSCGCSFITPELVVTAAHCVSGDVRTRSIKLGATLRDQGGVEYKVESCRIHPDYNRATISYDAAVCKIPGNVRDSAYFRAAALSETSATELPEGTMLTTAGWGNTQHQNETADSLRSVNVPLVSQKRCKEAYGDAAVDDSMVCAGLPEGGKDACQGDSGGPLYDAKTKELCGLVSWGYGCAQPNYPGVYTNLRNPSIAAFIEKCKNEM